MITHEQIEQLVRRQERAVQQKDIDGAMAWYDPNVVSFDVVNTLQKVGLADTRQRLVSWLAQFPGPFAYTVENLSITATNEVAFCHSFNHVKGKIVNGDEIDMRWRATICFTKRDGNWYITHEHSSVPFDPENGKALILLEN